MGIRLTTPHGFKGLSLRYVSVDGINQGVLGKVEDFQRFEDSVMQDFLMKEKLDSGWICLFADELAARFGIFRPCLGFCYRAATRQELMAQLENLYR